MTDLALLGLSPLRPSLPPPAPFSAAPCPSARSPSSSAWCPLLVCGGWSLSSAGMSSLTSTLAGAQTCRGWGADGRSKCPLSSLSQVRFYSQSCTFCLTRVIAPFPVYLICRVAISLFGGLGCRVAISLQPGPMVFGDTLVSIILPGTLLPPSGIWVPRKCFRSHSWQREAWGCPRGGAWPGRRSSCWAVCGGSPLSPPLPSDQ